MATVADLLRVLQTPKTLGPPKKWSETGKGASQANRKLEVACPVIIGGATVTQITFRARAMPDRANEDVSLMLQATMPGFPLCFARVDWMGSAHVNKRPGHRLHMEDAGRTHFHDPWEMASDTLESLRQSNLALAYPLPQEPKTFRELMEVSSRLLNIVNLAELEEPLWTPLGL